MTLIPRLKVEQLSIKEKIYKWKQLKFKSRKKHQNSF